MLLRGPWFLSQHFSLSQLNFFIPLSRRNAYAIALFLESHAGVEKVVYPGLPSHPQHELAKRQQHGFGAMITFYCHGGREQAASFLQNVRLRLREWWT